MTTTIRLSKILRPTQMTKTVIYHSPKIMLLIEGMSQHLKDHPLFTMSFVDLGPKLQSKLLIPMSKPFMLGSKLHNKWMRWYMPCKPIFWLRLTNKLTRLQRNEWLISPLPFGDIYPSFILPPFVAQSGPSHKSLWLDKEFAKTKAKNFISTNKATLISTLAKMKPSRRKWIFLNMETYISFIDPDDANSNNARTFSDDEANFMTIVVILLK